MNNRQDDPSRRKPDRAARLAEELRANLARRKAQARLRGAGKRVVQDADTSMLEETAPPTRES